MLEFREDTALTPGSWYLWKTGKKKVLLSCPACGGISLISARDVSHEGELSRNFWCRVKGCFTTDEGRLVGWRKQE